MAIVNKKKEALGKGIRALLSDMDEETEILKISDKDQDSIVNTVPKILLEYIEVNPYQPRKDFNEDANLGEKVLTIVMLSEKEFWLGEFLCIKAFQKFPFNDPQNELPKIAPSRAYLKIAQAFSLFTLKVNSGDIFLELGSAPGGASFFLLQKGCIVYGNDPAEMSEICLKDKNFFHLKKPVQNLKENDLPLKDIKWIAVDLNLNPSQVVTETIRIASFYKNSIEGILLTLKMINLDQVRRLNFFKREFEKKGFEKIEVLQLPSHKKEFLMLLQK